MIICTWGFYVGKVGERTADLVLRTLCHVANGEGTGVGGARTSAVYLTHLVLNLALVVNFPIRGGHAL